MKYLLPIYGDETAMESRHPAGKQRLRSETPQVARSGTTTATWLTEKGLVPGRRRASTDLDRDNRAGLTAKTRGHRRTILRRRRSSSRGLAYLLEVANPLTRTIEAGARCPGAYFGTIELRFQFKTSPPDRKADATGDPRQDLDLLFRREAR